MANGVILEEIINLIIFNIYSVIYLIFLAANCILTDAWNI